MLWHIWKPLAWRRIVWFFWGLILLALVLSQRPSEVRAKDQPGITPPGDEKGQSSGLQRPTTGSAGATGPTTGSAGVTGPTAGTPLPPAPSDQSIKIFTWGGPWTGYDLFDNQSALQTRPGDEEDADWYPTEASIKKLRNADIGYIQNHGGKITTDPVPIVSWTTLLGTDHIFVDLHFPTSDNEGPSLILSWGCENGRADLIEKYARGLGILKNSKTKVYIAPTFDISIFGDEFQESFFLEFSKGNVTVEEAAFKAVELWKQGALKYTTKTTKSEDVPDLTVVGDRTGGSTVFPESDLIGFWGNKDLTLNQIRANVAARPPPAGATGSEDVPDLTTGGDRTGATGHTTGSAGATGPTTGSAGTGTPLSGAGGQGSGVLLPGGGQAAAGAGQAAGTALPGAGQTGMGTGTGPAGAVAGQIDDHTDEIESHVDKIESHVDKIKSHVDNIKSWK